MKKKMVVITVSIIFFAILAYFIFLFLNKPKPHFSFTQETYSKANKISRDFISSHPKYSELEANSVRYLSKLSDTKRVRCGIDVLYYEIKTKDKKYKIAITVSKDHLRKNVVNNSDCNIDPPGDIRITSAVLLSIYERESCHDYDLLINKPINCFVSTT
jgi:hypothetical protein